jgi:hypothetical protein
MHVCAPERSDIVQRKSLNTSRNHTTERSKCHSLLTEVQKFKRIERITPHVFLQPRSVTLSCSGSHPSISCGMPNFPNIMSWGAGIMLASLVSLLDFPINSRSFARNPSYMPSSYSLKIWFSKFVLATSSWVILYHLQTPWVSYSFAIMGSPSNTGWGLRGSWSARSQPQHTWDSFPWALRGTTICPEAASTSTHRLGVVTDTYRRNKLDISPSSELKPQRRGRPKKKT